MSVRSRYNQPPVPEGMEGYWTNWSPIGSVECHPYFVFNRLLGALLAGELYILFYGRDFIFSYVEKYIECYLPIILSITC